MADNKNTKDDLNKLSAVWNAEPNGIGLDDKITIIENWSYEALKYLPPWIMPEAIESDGYYFVAYSRQDFKIVYTDILRLESVGVDIWYDRSMEPGRGWQEIAERMMNRQECKGVIVYGTVNSMASKPVQTELLVADELGKNIIFINHGEDSGATAAKALYEEAKKAPGADCACEGTTEKDRERVKAFGDLLDRIGNANITYIDLANPAARKKELLDGIKSEGILLYDKSDRDCGVITGVKYLGVREVKIPKNVTIDGKEYDVIQIGACAFANCRLLEKIELPSSLVEIKQHAFFGCKSLTKVYLGKKVTVIAENAFDNCTGLEEFVAEEPTVEETEKSKRYSKFFTKDGVLYERYRMDRTQPFRIYGVPPRLRGMISLPDGLRKVRRYAFSNCKNLVSVAIPDSVTSIGDSAFRGCRALTSLTIPDSVTSIGSYAFWDCTSLTSITIPDSVTSLGDSAFAYCDSLTSVTIGNSVTSIGNYAFEDCTSLTSVTIPDSVTSIGSSAISGCTSLTSVTIPDSVTSIGNYAFWGCTSLTSVAIPDSVTSIGSSAFRNCTSLTSITIPDSVTSIGSSAFEDCTSLTSVTIPDSVTSIGSSAISGCTSLTSVTIPDSVTSIGNYAFWGCTSLTSVTIPNGVTSIGNYAFRGCTSLTSVTIPESVTSIAYGAFAGCVSLETLTVDKRNPVYHSVGNCVIETATGALVQGCNNSVIPTDGSVTSIGDSAFRGCRALTSITIPDSVTSIGDSAFEDCDSLTSVTIPDSVTSIGRYAFQSCDSLTSVTFEGTMAEWEAVEEGWAWNDYCPFTEVKCSDGVFPV